MLLGYQGPVMLVIASRCLQGLLLGTMKSLNLQCRLLNKVEKVSEPYVYLTFDLLNCYWQQTLSPEGQNCQSIIISDGIYTVKSVLHGVKKSLRMYNKRLQN